MLFRNNKIKTTGTILGMLLVMGVASLAYGQSSIECIRFRQVNMKTILNEVEQTFNIHFNYTTNQLSNELFTFSFCGDRDNALEVVGNMLHIKFNQLGDIDYSFKKNYSNVNVPVYNGTIIDMNGDPLIGANIYLPKLGIGVQSDINGYITIKGFYDVNEEVEISYLGYMTKITSLGNLVSKPMVMNETDHQLESVTITDNRFLQNSSPAIERIDIANSPVIGAGGFDILQKIQLSTGIYNTSESLDDLQIRGGTPDQVGLTWNGIPLFQNNLFYGRLSVLNPDITDEIAINKNGALASSYTLASGAIAGSTSFRDTSTLSGAITMDLIHAGAALSSSMFGNKFKLNVAGRTSIAGQFESDLYKEYIRNAAQNSKIDFNQSVIDFNNLDYIFTDQSSRFYDWNVASRLEISPQDVVAFNFIQFENRFDYSYQDTISKTSKDDELSQKSLGFNGTYQRKWKDQSVTEFSAVHSTYERKYVFNNYGGEIEDDKSRFQEQYLELKHRLAINQEIDFTAGYQFNKVHSSQIIDSEVNPQNNKESVNSGFKHVVFTGLELKKGDWLNAYVGLRWNKYNKAAFNREISEPRVHIHYYPSKRWTIEGHFARTHQTFSRQQTSTPLELDNGPWTIADELSDNNFQYIVENSQYSVGFQYNSNKWYFKSIGYRKFMKNLWTSTFDFYWAENPYRYVNLDIKGLETSFHYKTRFFTSFITYDFILDEIINETTGVSFRSPYTQPNRISLGNVLNIDRFSFSIMARYASGRFYSEAVDYIETESPNGVILRELVYEELLDNQVLDYFNVDASIVYQWKQLKIGLHGSNLLNNNNVIKNQYFIDFRRNPIDVNIQQWMGLPFLYNFTLNYSF